MRQSIKKDLEGFPQKQWYLYYILYYNSDSKVAQW